jgi:prepilin peptidase CpaA
MFMQSASASFWGAVFTLELLIACATDVRSRRNPNVLVLVILVSGIAFSLATRPFGAAVVWSSAGVLLGFGIWFLFYIAGAIGAGDVKFFSAIGAWLGPSLTWRAALLAAVFGGLLAVIFLLRERRLAKTMHRIVLAVSSRTIRMLETSEASMPRRSRLPYGVALASGAFIAAWWPQLLV